MMQDPYKILGVSHDATEEEITKAYRRLEKKYHPDLNPGDETAAKHGAPLGLADIRNNEHHRKHRIGRPKIGDHIGDLCKGETPSHRQQKISHIGRRHTAQQKQEILFPLLLPQKIRHQQKHRKHGNCTIYNCQITCLQWTASL